MSNLNPIFERNQDATIYVGNLEQRVHEELIWELFIQVGPVVNVHMPRDKISGEHQGYGFVEFRNEEDADYAIKIMHMIKLYGRPIKVNKASQDKKAQDIGANIFIGNLDPEVDEKMLQETFGTFGNIVAVRIQRDNTSGKHHRFGFISYDNFESSDNAIQAMNGQFLCNRPIHVSYAFKRDSKTERHGSMAERVLAANRPNGKPTWTGNFITPQLGTPQMFNSMVSGQIPVQPPPIPGQFFRPPPPPPVRSSMNPVV
jgi:splicing factor 3B subunit 4